MAETPAAPAAAPADTSAQQVVNSHAAQPVAAPAGGLPTVTAGAAPPADGAKPPETSKPAPPVLGKIAARREAARAAAAAAEQRGGKPAPAAAKSAEPAKPAAAAAAVGLPAEEIAKLEAKADEKAEVDKVLAAAVPDFAKIAKEAQALAKTDPLAALEKLGIPIDEAVKQALGKAPGDKPTREQELEAERDALKAEIKARDEKAAADAAARAGAEQKAKVVQAVIADTRFPNITSAEHVEAAFAEARRVAKVAEAERGRRLTDTEGDMLVEHYLAKHNAKLGAASPSGEAKKPLQGQQAENIKAGAIRPPVGRRSLAQVEAERAAAAARER